MELNLKGRVVLITGASTGIGAQISRSLSQEGALLGLCSRNLDRLQHLASEDIFSEKNVLLINEDLSQNSGVESCVKKLIQRFGCIDALVNNVGGAISRGSFLELTDQDWIDTFELNVLSLVRFSKILRPYLSNSNQARIVSISSTTAQEPGKFDPHYSSAKAALTNLTKHLSAILADEQITVNSVSPGPIHTEGLVAFMESLDAQSLSSDNRESELFLENMNNQIPLRTLGIPEDVANIVVFLLSDKAQWITGANFRVDGGKSRGIF